MNISDISFGTTDWSTVERSEHPGSTGSATCRTRQFGAIRVRMVEYSAGYLADHCCEKGHILLCLQGELLTELQDGRRFTLGPGMSLPGRPKGSYRSAQHEGHPVSYQVADQAEAHRSSTRTGATLFIVD